MSRPKFGSVSDRGPVPKRTRLKTLNASHRKSTREFSAIGKDLPTEMFSL